MVHLSQFIQARNPMKNIKKCLNSTIFLIFLYVKTVKQQNKYNKIENRQQQKNRQKNTQIQKIDRNDIQLNINRKHI